MLAHVARDVDVGADEGSTEDSEDGNDGDEESIIDSDDEDEAFEPIESMVRCFQDGVYHDYGYARKLSSCLDGNSILHPGRRELILCPADHHLTWFQII